ncbi:MAG: RNA-binding transcriptional accessory protein [Bacteroidales bacterium]|nr:RNA-binding transcriptional accessory protein [Bacteroidales bacterium]
MKEALVQFVANDLQLSLDNVRNTISLLEDGATIPFVSRYRKERTGGLDEVQIEQIAKAYSTYQDIDKRKETILNSLVEQDKLTEALKDRIHACWQMTELEDIYLPYKPKRQTRAELARQKGLEPLAKLIMSQHHDDIDKKALSYLNDKVESPEDAIKGAKDIIAEWVSENEKARREVRFHFRKTAVLTSTVIKGKELEALNYKDYFEFSKPLKYCSSHQYLAITRGEREGLLRVDISPREEACIENLNRFFVKGNQRSSQLVKESINDAYKHLIKPSVETEFAAMTKERADEEAIRIFTGNLKQLLLAPPLGQKRVLGLDPGFRTGCKLVCLDTQGKLLHNETIYPHAPEHDVQGASRKVSQLVEAYDIQAIAIGNGTASRETESFVTNLRFDRPVQVFVVSENGASIYSASKVAREEFPEYDVTVRGAVSIARRLMDPLAELVKIEPKSIGVGQYQHDVDPGKLKQSLDQTVVNCVNQVGVNLNTASKYLLMYVSGLNTAMAQNIVDYRDANGPFSSREALLSVPRIGPKTFEQAAGFLRIPDADNPLDNSAVHPERYALVARMAADLGCAVSDLMADKALRERINADTYVSGDVGKPTLNDILQELDKPGRDPRKAIEVFEFDKNIHKLEDLKEGMTLNGIVTNITAFGCFVDIGIKENGLVHLSEMADRYIKDPYEVVSIHQHVRVKVLGIDQRRRRIQLSLKL